MPPPLKPDTREAKPHAREAILRSTLELIGQEGIGAVTNRAVATAAGVSLGSLTYHFPSQVDLLRETLLLYAGNEVRRLEGFAEDLRSRCASLEEVAAAISHYPSDGTGRLADAAEIELQLSAARDPRLRDASKRTVEAYEDFAAAALESLEVPEPRRHAPAIVALITGMTVRRLGTGAANGEQMADALLTLVAGAESR